MSLATKSIKSQTNAQHKTSILICWAKDEFSSRHQRIYQSSTEANYLSGRCLHNFHNSARCKITYITFVLHERHFCHNTLRTTLLSSCNRSTLNVQHLIPERTFNRLVRYDQACKSSQRPLSVFSMEEP